MPGLQWARDGGGPRPGRRGGEDRPAAPDSAIELLPVGDRGVAEADGALAEHTENVRGQLAHELAGQSCWVGGQDASEGIHSVVPLSKTPALLEGIV